MLQCFLIYDQGMHYAQLESIQTDDSQEGTKSEALYIILIRNTVFHQTYAA